MKAKLLTHKWACMLGAAFLGSLLWSCARVDGFMGFSFLLMVVLFLGCLASTILSLGLALARRSRESFYRVAINVIILLLLFPTIDLGSLLRDRLFLMRLPKLQAATELLIKNEEAKTDGERFTAFASLPASFANLNVLDKVEIRGAILPSAGGATQVSPARERWVAR